MTDSFNKVKKKFWFNAVVLGCLFGVCAALLVAGCTLIAVKLCKATFAWYFILLIAFGVFLVVFGVLFWLLHPTDKKIAKSLDKNFALNEKVQTMVEFGGVQTDLAAIQREDAAEKIANLPKKAPAAKAVVCCTVTPLLCLGIFLTGVLLPTQKVEEPTPPENTFEITNWQVTAIEQLIEEVKSSSLQTSVADACVTILQSLLEGLKQEQPESVMTAAVRSAISLIDATISAANSSTAISVELSYADTVTALSGVIAEGAAVYKVDGTTFLKYTQVQQKETGLEDEILEIFTTGTAFLYEATNTLRDNSFKERLTAYRDELNTALTDSQVAESDKLYASISTLSASFDKVLTSYSSGVTLAECRDSIVKACDDFCQSAASAEKVQAYSSMMGEYIDNRLAEIFSIDISGSDSSSSDDSTENSGAEDDKNTGGGYGDRVVLYGSDDVIFYPDDETYVEYGEVLDGYFAKMQEILNSGDLSEELKRYINNYFDILYSGLQTDSEQSQNN
jgi:hypothetical protein